MIKMHRKYFESPDGRREWAVTGEGGSLSFWCSPVREQSRITYGADYYGGVETHYNELTKPDYLQGNGRDDCSINSGKCWHDGTSLWASEYWIPYVLPLGDQHIWETLEFNYDLDGKKEMKP